MKRFTFAIYLALAAAALLAPKVSAQNYQRRDVPAIVNAGRDYDHHGGAWERARDDLARLDGQLNELRREIGGTRNSYIRDRFHSLRSRADRLSADFARHRIRAWEAQNRAEEIRRDAYALRRDLRARYHH
jgi:hypothetical protein